MSLWLRKLRTIERTVMAIPKQSSCFPMVLLRKIGHKNHTSSFQSLHEVKCIDKVFHSLSKKMTFRQNFSLWFAFNSLMQFSKKKGNQFELKNLFFDNNTCEQLSSFFKLCKAISVNHTNWWFDTGYTGEITAKLRHNNVDWRTLIFYQITVITFI